MKTYFDPAMKILLTFSQTQNPEIQQTLFEDFYWKFFTLSEDPDFRYDFFQFLLRLFKNYSLTNQTYYYLAQVIIFMSKYIYPNLQPSEKPQKTIS